MATLSEARSRDFITQIIDRLNENSDLLQELGYSSETKVNELVQQLETAQSAETAQQQAERAAREATKASQEALNTAYKNASASVDLIVSLLGRDHQLSKQLRKLRN
jgi:Zn-dependent metalloprotease